MWWTTYWPAPWLIVASVIAILFPAIFVMITFVVPRAVASVARLLRHRA